MTLIACLDPNNGILFNNRRQTLDYELVDIIKKDYSDIHISHFSENYFKNVECTVSDDPFATATEDSAVFFESGTASEHSDKITKLIIYRWNSVYPADTYFDLSPKDKGFKFVGRIKFSTKVHKDIVKEIYKK